ncbi:MAG: response regulator [candidate division KSB1 bacterium]|nr:response regulator [candidate division KSB1 bacterium]
MVEDKLILLVEDNPDDELLTLRAFEKNHLANRIEVVHDGQEALDFLFCEGKYAGRDPDDLPVVVLLDLKLPKLDGIEVLRQIRENERTQWLPVVVLTTSRQEQDIIDSYRLGANSYIAKPVDFKSFIEAVRQLGVYWLLMNELPPRRGES